MFTSSRAFPTGARLNKLDVKSRPPPGLMPAVASTDEGSAALGNLYSGIMNEAACAKLPCFRMLRPVADFRCHNSSARGFIFQKGSQTQLRNLIALQACISEVHRAPVPGKAQVRRHNDREGNVTI